LNYKANEINLQFKAGLHFKAQATSANEADTAHQHSNAIQP